MSLLLIRNDGDYEPWVAAFKEKAPSLEVHTPNTDHHPDEILMAMTWKAPSGSFFGYNNLKVIGSLGAGVDHLFADPSLPTTVQLTRVVDEKLSGDMQEFVLAHCLNHIKNLHRYSQPGSKWEPVPYRRVENVTVGILGFGTLGQAVGKTLNKVGFQVCGWSKSKKNINEIETFAEDQLEEFLSRSQILVCLLPLTPETEGILNSRLFKQLPDGAFLINVARGGHLDENDLLDAIESGKLSGAALDVFLIEPLPEDHAFWNRSEILITPHTASNSNPPTVVAQIVENYHRMRDGKELENTVSRDKKY